MGKRVVVVMGRIDCGAIGERIAAEYLRLRGYKIIQRNFRCGHLEIDIVAGDAGCLAFVEVKTRRNRNFGEAVEAVGRTKMINMRKAAQGFLSMLGNSIRFSEIRFDVVALDLDAARDIMVLKHLKGVL